MSNNPHDFNDPSRQGQYPPQWNTSQPEDNPSAHYPPASQYPYPPASYPPPAQAAEFHTPPHQAHYPPQAHPPPMAAIHQLPPDPYRLPQPPAGPYRTADLYPPQHVAAGPHAQVVYQAAAPRQRTAIACRYCRRRKIRCSGFESSQDGRCSNCIRFNQECMFTPVSSQAQAFVPAHAAYPHLRNQTPGRPGGPGGPPMLYGAHGQPLPPQQQPQGPDTTLPPPQGMYAQPYGAPPLASMPQDQRLPGRRGSGSGFEYPDPTNLAPVTPVTSNPGYSAHTAPSPYYPPPPDRRPSPQSAYPYDGRHSSSPHGSPFPPMHHPSQAVTPPVSTPTSSRGGLNVRDMLNPGDQGRSSTDSSMLNALNRGH